MGLNRGIPEKPVPVKRLMKADLVRMG